MLKYIFVISNSIATRLLSVFFLWYLGYLASSEFYGKLASYYNISMLVSGVLITPLITYLSKLEAKKFQYFDDVVWLKVSAFALIYFFIKATLNIRYLEIFLIISIGFLISQYYLVKFVKLNNDLKGFGISLLVNSFSWIAILFFVFFEEKNSLKFESIKILSYAAFSISIIFFWVQFIKVSKQFTQYKNDIQKSYLPIFFSSLMSSSAFLIYFMLVNSDVEKHKESLVTFNLCYQWFQIVVFFAVSVSNKLTSRLLESGENKNDYKNIIIFCVMIYIISIFVFLNIYDKYQIENSYDFLLNGLIFITASLFSAFSSILGCELLVKNREKFGVFLNAIWVFLLFISYFLCRSYLELSVTLSSSVSFLISYICHMINLLIIVRKDVFKSIIHK